MTREEAIDIVKCLVWHTRPDEEDVEQAIKALKQQPCEMTVNEYRNRLMDAFHNADCDELIAVVVRPEESEFKQLEWLLKNHYHNQRQQSCEDAVSRQSVLNIIMPYCKDDDGSVENTGDLRNALDDIESLSPVTSQPKIAHWINKKLIYKAEAEDERDCYAGTCSACGCVQECWNYCSGCGARMEEAEE